MPVPRFGLAGAAVLTAIAVVALALTGSGSNSSDEKGDPAARTVAREDGDGND